MYQTDRTSACGSSKERRHTPSTKGKSLFSLLLHPRSSMDSTTKAQSLQNKPSVPSFYQGRLHKDCWTTTSEGQESLWESRHCSSSHSTLGTLLYSQSVGSQGKDYPFNSLIQDQNIDLSSWKAPKKRKEGDSKSHLFPINGHQQSEEYLPLRHWLQNWRYQQEKRYLCTRFYKILNTLAKKSQQTKITRWSTLLQQPPSLSSRFLRPRNKSRLQNSKSLDVKSKISKDTQLVNIL